MSEAKAIPLHPERANRRPRSETASPGLNQDDLAWAFAGEIKAEFAFDHTDKQWLWWDGSRWTPDAKETAFHRARVFCKRRRADEDAPKELGKINTIAAVERAARSDPRVATSFEDWDRDPWLLGIPNGVICLRTGEVRPADWRLRIRKQTSVRPAPAGTPAPLWSAFLNEATGGDAEVRAFLQRLAGYFLTGDISEEMLTFLYGPGGNGKGVFLGALAAIMGDYHVRMPIDAFTAGSRLQLEYYRARMVGARLVTASETEAGATWSESLIKDLTGNEGNVSARNPHGRVFEYAPRFKLCIVGNHAPRLKGRTQAMERRLRIVPFTNEPTDPDPDLKEKLREEYPAILRWMLDGCAEWLMDRLGTSKAIQRATSAYFEQQDTLRLWMNERCDFGETLSAKPSHLHADYNGWRHASGEQSVSNTEFREMIERTKGLRYATNKGLQWVRGIALKADDATR